MARARNGPASFRCQDGAVSLTLRNQTHRLTGSVVGSINMTKDMNENDDGSPFKSLCVVLVSPWLFSLPANILSKDEFWLNILGISDSFRMIIRTGSNAGSKDMLTRREDTRHN